MYYLKEQVYFEPLFNSWYAWPYLLPPVQSARHVVNTHRRIMKSFVNNYQLHIMACKEPTAVGGEFLDASEDQVDNIKELIQKIETDSHDLVELCDAVKELDKLLRSHTSGESLEYLYEKIPARLKGYVELFFDLEHVPSYRLIEGLLYKSSYYQTRRQSVSFGLLKNEKQRPFVFSTPRLADDDHVHFDLDFNSPVLERILSARTIPLTEQEYTNIFENIEARGGLDYRELFTTEVPQQRYQPVSSGVRLQYTGHAGFLVESADISVLVDPVIASRSGDAMENVFGFDNLPEKIDFICLTHSHQDHFNIETLLQLRYKTDTILVPKNNGGTLSDPSMKLMLQQLKFNVKEMEDMESVGFKGGSVMALPFLGEHGDLNIRSKAAWFIELQGKKIFLGADSSNIDPSMYQHIHNVVGDIDLLAIGMECVGAPYTWIYGALHTKKVSKSIKDSRRLNGCDARLAYGMCQIFNPKEVYIYALGLEPWFGYFMGIEYADDSEQIIESNKMVDMCRNTDLHCEKLVGEKIIEYAV